MIENLDQLLEKARAICKERGRPARVAVAAAQDRTALSALLEAKRIELAEGILFGDQAAIEEILNQLKTKSAGSLHVRHQPDEGLAAREAAKAVSQGEAEILLKGKVRTSVLLKAVLDPEIGLRTGRLLSDVFIFEDPNRVGNQLVMITDGGVTLTQELKQKIEITQNAVELAHILGNERPKVALLSAVETVVPGLQSTVDAAVIAKMNQRGQIAGCIIDGPLALDNAISEEAAKLKGLESPVAGRAEILVAPNIEAANLLAKSTTYYAGYRLAHVIMGAKAPVLIPSRSDTSEAKLLSIALGIVVSYNN